MTGVQTCALPILNSTLADSGGTIHRITDNGWDEATLTYETRPVVDGPGLSTLGPVTTGMLEFFAHTVPWFPSGPTSIDYMPTDNPKTLEKLRNDKQMLRQARLDMAYGLVDLMDDARDAAAKVNVPYLMLHGLGDRIVPKEPVKAAIEIMPQTPGSKLAFYQEGYHLLLRDKEGKTVALDVEAWIFNHQAPLPSGAEAAKSQPALAALWGSKRR